MKTRNGFVSNSSSTSFICEICNRTEVGWDSGSLRDYDMVRCVNDHTFCTDHLIEHDPSSTKYYEIPEVSCPICSYVELSYPEIRRYFLKTTEITMDEVFVEIKKVNKRRKKVYDNEYVEYVLKNKNLTADDLLTLLKTQYPKYTDFINSLRN